MGETPLRKIRESMGLTQRDVAKSVGIDQSTYCKAEQGIQCNPDTAAKIARFFGEPLNELHVLYPERFARFMEKTV